MSESKHTPGPWSYLPRHIAESEPEVRAPAGWLICCTAGDEDARLIAAAPELLEALKAMVHEGRGASIALAGFGFTTKDLNAAAACALTAIAKAEGRP